MSAAARFVVRYRWIILVAWVAAVPLAAMTLPSLSLVPQSDSTQFLPASAPSVSADRLAGPFEGTDPAATAVLVAVRAAGPLTAADQAAVARVTRAVRAMRGVTAVDAAQTSPDRRAEEAVVVTSLAAAHATARTLVHRIRAVFPAAHPPAGLVFRLTGQLAQTADSGSAAAPGVITALSVLFILVLLGVVFRAALAPLLVLIPAALCLSLAMSLIAEAATAGLTVSQVTQELLIVLILGAGTDYGLFLAFRIREEISHGADRKDAVAVALSRVGRIVTYSAVTVAGALLSLLLSGFGLYRSLGPAMAIGLGVMLLASLTLTPALFAIFGRAAFWPRPPLPAGQRMAGLRARMAARLTRHPVPVLIAGAAVLGALAAGLAGLQTTALTGSVPAGSDSAAGAAAIAAHFRQASAGADEALFRFAAPVWGDPDVLARLQARLAAARAFRSVAGPGRGLTGTELTRLHAQLGKPGERPATGSPPGRVPAGLYRLYLAEARFISPGGRTVQYYVEPRAGATGSAAAVNAVPLARAAVTRAAAGVGARSSGLAGPDATAYDVQDAAQSSLARVVPVVLALIFVLLALLLRSLVAPWYLVLTVGLSYLATLGFAVIVFVRLGAETGLNSALPFLVFVFAMALGADYNILLMSRLREEAGAEASFRDALVRAMAVSGGTITSAGVILAGTFAVLGIAGGGSQAQQLGFTIAFGVLLDTFFVRTLLVPAIAALLGRRNWWPSRTPLPTAHVPPADLSRGGRSEPGGERVG